MLKICRGIGQLDFRQLMDVYEETNRLTGKREYPKKPENLQILFAEQDFYSYLELFFGDPKARYAVWVTDGVYMAALRLEQYRDGLLITALEVPVEARRKGVATHFLEAVKTYCKENATGPLYSHVDKKNLPSLRVHNKCGFSVIAEEAAFLDGSIHKDHVTLYFD